MLNPALKRAIEEAGGITALARLLGITRQTISYWSHPGRKIPAGRIVEIERLTGVAREELRPDLYVPLKYKSQPESEQCSK